jgi:hypothetical protein
MLHETQIYAENKWYKNICLTHRLINVKGEQGLLS